MKNACATAIAVQWIRMRNLRIYTLWRRTQRRVNSALACKLNESRTSLSKSLLWMSRLSTLGIRLESFICAEHLHVITDYGNCPRSVTEIEYG